MPNDLVPNPRKRKPDFFQNLLPPEQREDEGVFGLGRYQPLPEFERPRQQDPAPAPGILRLGQGNLAPAPMLRQPGETFINGGDVGVRTNHFPNQSISAPAPIDYQPSPSGYESLVRAPRLQGPEPTLESYGEQYRRGHEKPELAPAPGISKKRRIGAALATFAAEFGRAGAGYRVGQQILYGLREREERGHERRLEAWQEGLEEARERDIGEGRQARERRAQEVHGRYESPGDVQSRRAQEAEAQGLTGEAAQRYILTGKVAQPRDGRPERYTRTRPGGESELLERRLGEEYYRPAEMLAPGVRELAQPTTITGVGGQEMELPAPPPPTEAVVSHPRPTRPLARDARNREAAMIEETATDYLTEANGDPDEALALLEEELRLPNASAEFRRLASKIRNRIRERVRPGRSRRSTEGDRLQEILGPVQ